LSKNTEFYNSQEIAWTVGYLRGSVAMAAFINSQNEGGKKLNPAGFGPTLEN